MDMHNIDNATTRRIAALQARVDSLKEHNYYFYNQPVQEILDGANVRVNGRVMGMYASYSYLGTGTNGVRTLAGTLTLHNGQYSFPSRRTSLPRVSEWSDPRRRV